MRWSAEERARLIIQYLNQRGIGHTFRMLNGVDEKSIVLARTISEGKDMVARSADIPPKAVLSLSNLDALRGQRLPLAIDHTVIIELLEDLMRAHVEELEMYRRVNMSVTPSFFTVNEHILKVPDGS